MPSSVCFFLFCLLLALISFTAVLFRKSHTCTCISWSVFSCEKFVFFISVFCLFRYDMAWYIWYSFFFFPLLLKRNNNINKRCQHLNASISWIFQVLYVFHISYFSFVIVVSVESKKNAPEQRENKSLFVGLFAYLSATYVNTFKYILTIKKEKTKYHIRMVNWKFYMRISVLRLKMIFYRFKCFSVTVAAVSTYVEPNKRSQMNYDYFFFSFRLIIVITVKIYLYW